MFDAKIVHESKYLSAILRYYFTLMKHKIICTMSRAKKRHNALKLTNTPQVLNALDNCLKVEASDLDLNYLHH